MVFNSLGIRFIPFPSGLMLNCFCFFVGLGNLLTFYPVFAKCCVAVWLVNKASMILHNG